MNRVVLEDFPYKVLGCRYPFNTFQVLFGDYPEEHKRGFENLPVEESRKRQGNDPAPIDDVGSDNKDPTKVQPMEELFTLELVS
ncbi:UNVERIFIED_CONTAM: hypothetical protein Sangu_2131800 [Sesamum angustifolium]|uniref:Uncharacterized protein n=1 Tax=Sesamum angustifolium TaxID=2727405 RepID=A0AAW2LCZ3_9LAMI